MITEHLYSSDLKASDVIGAVQSEGALLLRDFVAGFEQDNICDEVLGHELKPVDRTGHTVPEQFHDTGWEFEDAPPPVKRLGVRIMSLVKPELPKWYITSVRAQLYSPGEVGIEWHRDYKRDVGIVAVASFMGSARFDIELNSGLTSWQLHPGDLVLMRGALLTGRKDDRPRHRVKPPVSGQRLSVVYRQVLNDVPYLEPLHG